MVTTGSKTYYSLGAALFALAVLYGITSNTMRAGVLDTLGGKGAVDAILGPITFGYKGGVGDHFGYAILMGAAAFAVGIGATLTAFRDNDADVVAAMEGAHPGTTGTTAGPAYWPMAGALAVALMILGLAVSSTIFVVGLVVAILVGFAWTVQALVEQISSSRSLNRTMAERLATPVALPVLLVIAAVLAVFCFSRLLLANGEIAASIIAAGTAAVVIGVAFVLATRPHLSRTVILVVIGLLVALLIGAGIGGGVAGPAKLEEKSSNEEGSPAKSFVTAAAASHHNSWSATS